MKRTPERARDAFNAINDAERAALALSFGVDIRSIRNWAAWYKSNYQGGEIDCDADYLAAWNTLAREALVNWRAAASLLKRRPPSGGGAETPDAKSLEEVLDILERRLSGAPPPDDEA